MLLNEDFLYKNYVKLPQKYNFIVLMILTKKELKQS